MSNVSIPSFVGKTHIIAEDLDAAFQSVAAALSGGLDETNLVASAKLAPAQFQRGRGLSVLSFMTGYLSYGADNEKVWKVPIIEEALVVGYSMRLYKDPADTAFLANFSFTATFESSDAPGASIQVSDTLDEDKKVFYQPFKNYQIGTFNPKHRLAPDTWLSVGLRNNNANHVIPMAGVELFLARPHTDR